jgi:hypothetical protein
MTPAAKTNSAGRGQPAPDRGQGGDAGGHAFQLRLLALPPGGDGDIDDIKADQDHTVDPGEAACQGNGQGIGRGQAEKKHFRAALGFEDHGLACPPPDHDGHRHPGHTDEQPVGPGHVGDGEMGVVGCGMLAGHPGEIHVHGVFRQHGNQRHHGQGQGLGDVVLGHVAGPQEQKRGGQDGPAGDDRGHGRGQMHRGQAAHQTGQGGSHGQPDG